MAMSSLFLLFASSVLSLVKVHCLTDYSSPVLLSSNVAIQNATSINWKAIYKPTPHDTQSNFNIAKYRENRGHTRKVEANVTERPEMIQLLFQKNSNQSHFKCKFSIPLHFNYTGMYNITPKVFERLKKVAALLLDYNNLNLLNVTISQVPDFVEILEINTNSLTVLPHELLRDLPDLKTIKLNANNFSTIPGDLLLHNRKLKTVQLTLNNVELDQLPSKLFSGFADLKAVLLQNIGLNQLPEDLFWNSYNLKEIDLSNNNLEVLPKNLLRDARELRILNLSGNSLATLTNGLFTAANQLLELDLSLNYIKALNSSDLFTGLHNLEILNMYGNYLKFIHADAFITLPNLKIAEFPRNYLNLTTGLYDHFGQVSPFRHCRFLEELNLSHNRVTEIFSDWVVTHTLLRKLDLSHNKFSYVESKNLRFNSSNLYVDLSHNFIKIVNLTQLEKIPKISNSSRDVVIDLNWNPIDCYCDVHSLVRYVMNETSDWLKPEDLNYIKLKTDDLVCNMPTNLLGKRMKELYNKTLFCGLPNAPSLSCTSAAECFCQLIPRFSTLAVYCAGKNLTSAPNWIYSWHISSAHVNLSGNALQRTPDVTKGGYEGPRELYLDLSRNKIDRIEKHSVNKNLREFYLDHNNLTEIDIDIVEFLASETTQLTLRMLENPWPCNFQILKFEIIARRLFDDMPFWKYWDMKDSPCNSISAILKINNITSQIDV